MELPEVIGKEAVKLPEHLDTSLRGLKQARTLLASGDITLVALAARMAFERAIIWLERVEQINLKPFQSARRDIHQVRAEAAAAVLGVASKDLHRLLAHSEADEYGVTL